NYPNPFNPSTSIHFSIPSSEFVTLKVFDMLGNEVATIINEEKPAGSYQVEFNASQLSSGIYFYTINAGSFIETRKMILLK
ncbi:MAG: T9SS type A sorting domain-containing protein, partial [Ignavibacteriaceae bacterium]